MLDVLQFVFGSFWVYCGFTFWLMLAVAAFASMGPVIRTGGKKARDG